MLVDGEQNPFETFISFIFFKLMQQQIEHYIVVIMIIKTENPKL